MQTHPPSGTLETVTVFAPPDGYSAFPCLMQTHRDLVLDFMYQPLGPLRESKLHPHYAPVMSRKAACSQDGGRTWSVTDDPYPLRDPLIATTRGDYYAAAVLPDHSLYTMSLLHKPGTTDQYLASHRIRETPSGKILRERPLPNHTPLEQFNPFSMVHTADGTLLAAGYWYEAGRSQMSITFLRSLDNGNSWTYGSKITSPGPFGLGEPGLTVLDNGRIIAMLRAEWSCVKYPDPADWPDDVNGYGKTHNGYGYYLYQSESDDHGATWTTPHQLPIWGHPGFLLQLKSGRTLLVYGHRRPPFDIRAILSSDGCRSWDINTLRTLHTFNPGHYDIGYPVALQMDDGRILCAFYGYSTGDIGEKAPHGIFASRFDESWMMQKGNAGSSSDRAAGNPSTGFDAKAIGLAG